MNKELREMLTWINENLKAVVSNQTELYCRLKDIETELKQTDEK